MPMGHLILGLLGGIAAVVLALAAGSPLWMTVLLYLGVGNLVLLGSVAVRLLTDHARKPPSRPVRAIRRTAKLRIVHVHH